MDHFVFVIWIHTHNTLKSVCETYFFKYLPGALPVRVKSDFATRRARLTHRADLGRAIGIQHRKGQRLTTLAQINLVPGRSRAGRRQTSLLHTSADVDVGETIGSHIGTTRFGTIGVTRHLYLAPRFYFFRLKRNTSLDTCDETFHISVKQGSGEPQSTTPNLDYRNRNRNRNRNFNRNYS